MKSEQSSLTKTSNERGEVKQRESRSAALVGGCCRGIGLTCVAGTQKRFGLLLLLVVGGVALLMLSGTQAVGQPETSYSVLYNFCSQPNCADGGGPYAGVISDTAGNLYGTTFGGGSSGVGVVFKLDPKGNETVLHSFSGGTDGGNPQAGLIRDSVGNLYGTTASGGNLSSPLCFGFGCGVVFKLDPPGNETVLYSFSGGADGSNPLSGLIRDVKGNLYGTTAFGGNGGSSCPFGTSGCGVVFKLDPSGNETVLYTFSGGADGSLPAASLIRDEDGNLYSTTQFGGNFSSPSCAGSGCGVAFKLDPSGNETALYSFSNGADGGFPVSGLAQEAAGNLYGTTGGGGNLSSPLCARFSGGCGVVFKVDPLGRHFSVLYTFTGAADGSMPLGGLTHAGDDDVWDPAGNLYGTASSGGNLTSPPCVGNVGCGVVFKLNPAGKQTVLHTFNGTDGSRPAFEVLLKHHGSLYGTTSAGGLYGAGVIFKLTLDDE